MHLHKEEEVYILGVIVGYIVFKLAMRWIKPN